MPNITLTDGRTLAYEQYGAENGDAVFALHSTPGLGSMWQLAGAPARELGLRIIAPDRPGYGNTPFHATRTLEEYPGDIAQLADRLGVERFALLGFSGGGFHAALVARALPERVRALGMFGAFFQRRDVGVLQRLFLATARNNQPLLRTWSFTVSCIGRGCPRLVERIIHSGLPSGDQRVLDQPGITPVLEESLAAAYVRRPGFNREVTLFAQAPAPEAQPHTYPVQIWHGVDDNNVLVSAARRWSTVFPDAAIEEIPDAGHFWLFANFDSVLATLRRMMDA